VVEGAALAIKREAVRPDELLLVGDESALKPLLAEHELEEVKTLHADQVIGMHESPASAIRNKRASSIVVGMQAVHNERADAFLSAGNTGAVVAASSLVLGRLKGPA
jgi:glycerol-3-phosphate acyltransferase PlsX